MPRRPALAALALFALLALASPRAATDDGAVPLEAVKVETTFGPVLISAALPADHYVERFDDRAYWLPGVAEGTPLVHKVIQVARDKADSGARVMVRTRAVGERRVFLTDTAPFPGVFALSAGDTRAWLPGVRTPDEAQIAALEQAIVAETGVKPERPALRIPPAAQPLGTGVLREKSAAAAAERDAEAQPPPVAAP
jgi:hypothetical protein